MVYKIIKSTTDAAIQWISRALPPWKGYEVERVFPARQPYQPALPANVSMFSPQVEKLFTDPIHFPEHRIYRLHNVHVTWDGAVFHNLRLFVPSIVHPRFATRFQDTLLLRQWVGERVAPQETCVAVCHDQWSVENYYHWLVDTLPRLLVLRQHHPDIILMIPQPLPPKQLPEYISRSAKAFGFESFMPVTTRQIMSAECVVLPELTAPSLTQNPELITGVRSILLKELHSGQVHPTRKIYAARALQGVRRLVNEAEVDEVLKGFGFEKIYFDRLTFLQQIALMRQTSVFLGVHGAAMANMLFLPESAKVIELLNEDSGELCYFRLASCLGLDYFYAPCKATNPELGNQSDMMASAELLEKIVSITLAR